MSPVGHVLFVFCFFFPFLPITTVLYSNVFHALALSSGKSVHYDWCFSVSCIIIVLIARASCFILQEEIAKQKEINSWFLLSIILFSLNLSSSRQV